jgi:hypothetical protein
VNFQSSPGKHDLIVLFYDADEDDDDKGCFAMHTFDNGPCSTALVKWRVMMRTLMNLTYTRREVGKLDASTELLLSTRMKETNG